MMIFSIDFAATAHFFKKHFFIYIPFWKKVNKLTLTLVAGCW